MTTSPFDPKSGHRYFSSDYFNRVWHLLDKKDRTPARRYAKMCLEASATEAPFYLGFAHEAMSRAAKLKNDPTTAAEHLEKAREQLALIEDEDSKKMLAADLDALKGGAS